MLEKSVKFFMVSWLVFEKIPKNISVTLNVMKICVQIVHCALSAFFYEFERFEKIAAIFPFKYYYGALLLLNGPSIR